MMGDYGLYVWTSVFIVTVVLALNALFSLKDAKKTKRLVKHFIQHKE